jgi:UDP-GlcNAc:undecaprenyl-phosphate GlcNAc-1-phosphate transferase
LAKKYVAMLINYSLIYSGGFMIAAALTGILKVVFLKRHLLIQRGIPLSGGIALTVSFFLVLYTILIFSGRFPKTISGFFLSALFMFIFGLVDDFRELSVKSKFLTQIIACVILIFCGVKTNIVYFDKVTNMVITLIWLVGVTNALNHLDVIDGLAAGTAIIVSLSFFIISLVNLDFYSSLISLILASVSSGFLIFNFPPAKVYMGNSGSHFLGFSLAALALLISYAPLDRKIALFSPIAVLWFPIFDTIFLMLLRISKGRSIFKKSNDHFALRLLKSGYTKKGALWFMLLVAGLFSSCGVFLSQSWGSASVLVITVIIIFSFILYKKLGAVRIDG